MTKPSPNPEAVEAARIAFEGEVETAIGMRRKDHAIQRAIEAAEPLIRTDERRKVLTELAEEFGAEAAGEDAANQAHIAHAEWEASAEAEAKALTWRTAAGRLRLAAARESS